jgi:toxin-antitoxin system PIN domain toxin
MSVFLLDTNAILALIWTTHIHHSIAQRWMANIGSDRWATCPMTQCGFVRISSNPHFRPHPVTPLQAMNLLQTNVQHPSHVFWPDNADVGSSQWFPRHSIRGHQQVTDAYLLTLCLENGGRLATFDAGISSLATTPQERAAICLLT